MNERRGNDERRRLGVLGVERESGSELRRGDTREKRRWDGGEGTIGRTGRKLIHGVGKGVAK